MHGLVRDSRGPPLLGADNAFVPRNRPFASTAPYTHNMMDWGAKDIRECSVAFCLLLTARAAFLQHPDPEIQGTECAQRFWSSP